MPGIGIGDHQVARHEVAVDEELRLRQMVGDQHVEHLRERVALLGGKRCAEVPADVPLGEELELATQQRLVVRRQRTGARGELPLHERVGGIVEQGARVALVQRGQIRRRRRGR